MRKTYRTKYYEFTTGWSGFNLTYHIAGYFNSKPSIQIYFIWGSLFLYLPWKHYKKVDVDKDLVELRKDKLKTLSKKSKYSKISKTKTIKILYYECEAPRYGITIYDNMLTFRYDNTAKSFLLPFYWTWIRTSCLARDGKKWYSETRRNRNMEFFSDKWKNKLFSETYTYEYITKHGDVQKTEATIMVKEREWRWHWTQWSKFPRKIRKTIDVSFSTEIGERSNSWKGGTTGCDYEMLPGETPYQTLKRMEKNRKF